jgi:hypothetical protein
MAGHFTIAGDKISIRVTDGFTDLRMAYVKTGDLAAYRKMLACIEAVIDKSTTPSTFRRIVNRAAHALWVGLEIEGWEMYPSVPMPPDVANVLLGDKRPIDSPADPPELPILANGEPL